MNLQERLKLLAELYPDDTLWAQIREMLASADPELAESILVIVEAAADSTGVARLFLDVRSEYWPLIARLCAQGPYPSRVLIRHSEYVPLVHEWTGDSLTPEKITSVLGDWLEAEPELSWRAGLRRLKALLSLSIFHDEICEVSTRDIGRRISHLADACIDIAVRQSAEELGLQDVLEHFCVLGMGKLGGNELNYSSDVDLVYVASDKAFDDEELRRQLDILAREVTEALDARTPEGYVFRVDLRLRPEGSAGVLVPTSGSVREYFRTWARTWERSAWSKSRPVAGNVPLGETLLTSLQPLIFRRHLDFEVIEDLRTMKESIHRNARVSQIFGFSEEKTTPVPGKPHADPQWSKRLQRKLSGKLSGRQPRHKIRSDHPVQAGQERKSPQGVVGWDVKIGIGGIREIEFFVQALQLIHGGTRPNIRKRSTLDALDALLWAGLVNHRDHVVLADAYDLYRRVEHRIQMENDQPLHALPAGEVEFGALAQRMGRTTEELGQDLKEARVQVREIFDRLFESSDQRPEQPTVPEKELSAVELILALEAQDLSSNLAHDLIKKQGFARPRQVSGQLQVLRGLRYGPFAQPMSEESFKLASYLLQVSATAPDPVQAFSGVTRWISTIGDRPGHWKMLADNPHATRLLVHVFGSSRYLSASLTKEPQTFERLVSASTIAVRRSKTSMAEELDQRLVRVEDPAHRFGVIRRFHREEILRLGLHDSGGQTTIESTTYQLSSLAEVVINRIALEVYEPLRTRKKRPGVVLPPLEEIPFAIVAMGKLGGKEIGFGSDLDILFVYDEDRQFRLEHTFYARLAQRIIRTLSAASEEGIMYAVDTRLRPSGSQGALVVGMDTFETYHLQDARLWERQALLRARPILGSTSLQERVMKTREKALGRALPANAAREIADMVKRLQDSQYTFGTEDLKFGPGGLVELEFMVQLLQLRHTEEHGISGLLNDEFLDEGYSSQNTLLAIDSLPEIKAEDLTELRQDYRFLRIVENRLRLLDHSGQHVIPEHEELREALARRLGYQGPQAAKTFMDDFRAVRARTAKSFRTTFSAQ